MAGLWLCCGLSPVLFSQAINTERYLVLIWVGFNVLTFPELGFHINLEQRGKLRCFLVFSEVMEAFSEAFDIRRVNLVSDPKETVVCTKIRRYEVVSPANSCRDPR